MHGRGSVPRRSNRTLGDSAITIGILVSEEDFGHTGVGRRIWLSEVLNVNFLVVIGVEEEAWKVSATNHMLIAVKRTYRCKHQKQGLKWPVYEYWHI